MNESWKRLLVVLLALAFVAAACGDDDDDTAAEPTVEDTATDEAATDDDTTDDAATDDAATDDAATDSGEKVSVAILLPCAINDLSWCQAAYEGVKELESEGLIDLQIVDDAPFDAQGATRVMSGFANEGVDLVIGHSFDYGAPIHEMAPDFPDTHFAWQGSCGGFCGVEGPNITDYAMPMHEPAYLSGILAGGISESGILGSNSGFDIPVCRATIEAFLLGAQEIQPDATRLDAFLGSWVDAALAKEATAAQAEQGADVFVACGNAGSFGMIQEARESGLSAYGYVYDASELAPDNVVASMAWQIGVTYRAIVEDIAADDFQAIYDIPMSEGGFEVQLNPDYSVAEISPEALELFETRLAEITSGEFEVPFVAAAEE
jgi:basic membrane protein A and related proteins